MDKTPHYFQGLLKTNMALFLIPLLGLIFLAGCSSSQEDPKAWEPQLDQVVPGSRGGLDFGRTHYVIHKRDSMNKMRENQVIAFMDKVCKGRKARIIRRYDSESDFVSLRVQYSPSLPIKVFEFQCR